MYAYSSIFTSILYAATSTNIKHPQALRTYSTRTGGLNPTIVEAVCATMATPPYFVPVQIGRSQQSFVGGPVGANNPTRELLKEASTVFGNERRVAQVISVGCGIPPVQSLEAMTNEAGPSRLLKEIPIDCQTVATELAARLYNVDAYLRMSVEKGIGNIEMDQWGMLGDIEVHTARYTESQTISHALEASLKRLMLRSGTVTLGHLSK
jgi:predicted acylesterase/phospholipase RssA